MTKDRDGCSISNADQAMERLGPAGYRVRDRRAVDPGLQIGRDGVETGCIGTRSAGRRHRSRPQLTNDFFPDFRAAGDVDDINLLEAQTAGFQPIAVTAGAVLVENPSGRCLVDRGCGSSLLGPGFDRGPDDR